MTYRFDMKDKVSPAAIQKAWGQTLTVYPYMGYAVAVRKGKLVLLENSLPFVIKETSEVVEPFERAGNFHSVTFCYLENVLWIYVDHVPVDGTGFKAVLETFFSHYYCALNGCEYEIPRGIYAEKDGPVQGQDVDAYLMADAIDPKTMLSALKSEKTFVPTESAGDDLFLTREACRGYCIRVPSDEFMAYAKSVGGSPMSALAVFLAKTMERVHPENTLPVSLTAPVSVRGVMGNTNSLLHQVVHAPYTFKAEDLQKDDASINAAYRFF